MTVIALAILSLTCICGAEDNEVDQDVKRNRERVTLWLGLTKLPENLLTEETAWEMSGKITAAIEHQEGSYFRLSCNEVTYDAARMELSFFEVDHMESLGEAGSYEIPAAFLVYELKSNKITSGNTKP